MASLTAKGCTELARWEKVEEKSSAPGFIQAVRKTYVLRSDGALLCRLDLRENDSGKARWSYGSFQVRVKRVKDFPDQTAVTGWMTAQGYRAVA